MLQGARFRSEGQELPFLPPCHMAMASTNRGTHRDGGQRVIIAAVQMKVTPSR